MWHPFELLSPTLLGWLLLAAFIATILMFARLESFARRLKTPEAPLGIVSLELSLTDEESEAIIDSWNEIQRESARRHLLLDYWFIPVYTTALAMMGVFASRWFSERGYPDMANFALILAWGQWLIGLIDFCQNSILLRILQMYPDVPDRLPSVSGWCARIKFLMLILTCLACLFGLLTSLA